MKTYTDKARKAAPSQLRIGDKVLMKRTGIGKKDDSRFLQAIFTVIKVKYSMVTVQNEKGQQYTRNISFQTVNPQNEVSSHNQDELSSEEKTYPKRICKNVRQYILGSSYFIHIYMIYILCFVSFQGPVLQKRVRGDGVL